MKKLLTAALIALACVTPSIAQNVPLPQTTVGSATPTIFVDPATGLTQSQVPVRGQTTPVGATFTTPSGTSAYSAGQLIANSATAGSVTPLSFAACLSSGGNGGILAARIKTTDTGFAGKKVVLHLHRTAPTYSNGDHATWLTTESDALPAITATLSDHYSDAEKGFGTPDLGSTANGRGTLVGFDCPAGVTVIYGELAAGEAITPQGAKAFTVVLEVVH